MNASTSQLRSVSTSGARPNAIVELHTASTPHTSTRRRPKREASGPLAGETTSCASEKAAKIRAVSARSRRSSPTAWTWKKAATLA